MNKDHPSRKNLSKTQKSTCPVHSQTCMSLLWLESGRGVAKGQWSRKGRQGPEQEALKCRVKILDFLPSTLSQPRFVPSVPSPVPSIAFKVGFRSVSVSVWDSTTGQTLHLRHVCC